MCFWLAAYIYCSLSQLYDDDDESLEYKKAHILYFKDVLAKSSS